MGRASRRSRSSENGRIGGGGGGQAHTGRAIRLTCGRHGMRRVSFPINTKEKTMRVAGPTIREIEPAVDHNHCTTRQFQHMSFCHEGVWFVFYSDGEHFRYQTSNDFGRTWERGKEPVDQAPNGSSSHDVLQVGDTSTDMGAGSRRDESTVGSSTGSRTSTPASRPTTRTWSRTRLGISGSSRVSPSRALRVAAACRTTSRSGYRSLSASP